MSDLQIILIALGVLIIVGVLIYNWRQERKLRNNIAQEFIVPQKDVLVDEFYIDADAHLDEALSHKSRKSDSSNKANAPKQDVEAVSKEAIETTVETVPQIDITDDKEPSTDGMNTPYMPESEENEVSEPVFGSHHATTEVENESPPAKELIAETSSNVTPSSLPDDVHRHIDLTAMLYASENINMQSLLPLSDAIEKEMSTAMMMVHILDEHDVWHVLADSVKPNNFKQIACSIQLADRGGPIAKHTLNKFQFSVENMGLELNAHVEWQNNGDAFTQATDLDQFCMEVDQLVNVHLVQDDTPVHGTKFKGLAEASNLELGEDGKYYYPGSTTDSPQFVLINADHQPFTIESLRNNVVKGASFQIEIPKVTNCEQTFIQMIKVAKKMAAGMNARIVDDNEKVLGKPQIEKIQQQLKMIHAKMVARGVMPGSKSTLRLFN